MDALVLLFGLIVLAVGAAEYHMRTNRKWGQNYD